jgi:hypothetical protein
MITEKILAKALTENVKVYLDQRDVSNLTLDQIYDLIDQLDPVSITINGKMYIL